MIADFSKSLSFFTNEDQHFGSARPLIYIKPLQLLEVSIAQFSHGTVVMRKYLSHVGAGALGFVQVPTIAVVGNMLAGGTLSLDDILEMSLWVGISEVILIVAVGIGLWFLVRRYGQLAQEPELHAPTKLWT
jgi:hypothetical protein